MAPRLGMFLDQDPELSLELVVSERVGNLVADGFDAAVRFGDPEPSSLVFRRLLRTRILTCASPAYLRKKGRPRQPRDLAHGHTCIHFRDPHTGRPFACEFHRGKGRLTVDVTGQLVVNDSGTGLAACISEHGIAQVMELGTSELIADGVLVPLFPRWQDELFPLHVVYPSRLLPSEKVRAFLDFVVESAQGTA